MTLTYADKTGTWSRKVLLRYLCYLCMSLISFGTALFAVCSRFSQPFVGINSCMLAICLALRLIVSCWEIRWFGLAQDRRLRVVLLLSLYGETFVLANYLLYSYAVFPMQTVSGAVWMWTSQFATLVACIVGFFDRRFTFAQGRFSLSGTAFLSMANAFMFLRWTAGYV